MAACVDASVDDTPVEFSSEAEENAYFQKLNRARAASKTQRRMTMMGGMGLQGPQEHCGFFKLNMDVADCPQAFALRAGSLLKSVSNGILGASFRPLRASEGAFDWIFKVQFKSPEDVEVFYDGVEDMVGGHVGAEELVASSLFVDLPGLRGGVKQGTGEVLALFKASEGAATPLESMLDAVEIAAPAGMISSSMREPHKPGSLYNTYESLQPGYTHALCIGFADEQSLAAFMESGCMATITAPLIADKSIDDGPETPSTVLAYVF